MENQKGKEKKGSATFTKVFFYVKKYLPPPPPKFVTFWRREKGLKSPLFLDYRFLQLASNSNKFLLFSLTCSQIWLSPLVEDRKSKSNKQFLSVNQSCCCCSCSCFPSQARVFCFQFCQVGGLVIIQRKMNEPEFMQQI